MEKTEKDKLFQPCLESIGSIEILLVSGELSGERLRQAFTGVGLHPGFLSLDQEAREDSILLADFGYSFDPAIVLQRVSDPGNPLIICCDAHNWDCRLWCLRHEVPVFFEWGSLSKLFRLLSQTRSPGQATEGSGPLVILDSDPESLQSFRQLLIEKEINYLSFGEIHQCFAFVQKITPGALLFGKLSADCTALEALTLFRQVPDLEDVRFILLYDTACGEPALDQSSLGPFELVPHTTDPAQLLAISEGQFELTWLTSLQECRTDMACQQFLTQRCAFDEHAIVCITNQSGVITYVNQKFCSVSQYKESELVGSNHQLVNSGYHDSAFFAEMWARIRSGLPWKGEIKNRRKDGSYYWVKTTIAPQLPAGQKPTSYIAIQTDITAEKNKELSLAHRNDRFSRSQDFANIGTWDWNIRTGELHWSPRIGPLFGYQNEIPETTYENFLNKVHPEDRQAVIDAVEDCIAGNSEYLIEHRILRDDGSIHWVLEKGGVVKDEQGQPSNMLGVVQDITERKILEFRLSDQSSALISKNRCIAEYLLSNDFPLASKILLENGAEILGSRLSFIWDFRSPGSTFLFRNFPGFSPEAPLNWSQLKGQQPALAASFEQALSNLSGHQHVIWAVDVNGQKLEMTLAPVTVGKQVLAILGFETGQRPFHLLENDVFLEIYIGGFRVLYFAWQAARSDRVLKEKLINARNLAEEASKSKSRFLSHMSHELRTPLNAIIGFSQLLLCDYENELSPQQKKFVDEIEKAGFHQLQLINGLLEIAVAEASSPKLYFQQFDLHSLVEECFQLLKPIADKHSVSLINSVRNKGESLVWADPMALKQVLINLISNGIKYNNPDGYLKVSCVPVPNGVRIKVVDNGPGISPALQPRLFTEFERLGKRDVEGTGIGLVICQRLIKSMKGQIGVESVPGEGCTFWVELQRDKPELPVAEVADSFRSSEWQPAGESCIVYVEDNPVALQLMSQIMCMYPNIELHCATDGNQGLALIETLLPDLIITDLHLPGLCGVDLLEKVKQDPKICTIPVIALTANYNPDLETMESRHHFDDVLTKPIDISTLIRTLQNLL